MSRITLQNMDENFKTKGLCFKDVTRLNYRNSKYNVNFGVKKKGKNVNCHYL